MHPGQTVADFGSGAGHYAFEAARIAGPNGHVYALEIVKSLVETIAREARREHLRNLDALWVDLEKPGGSHIRTSSIDRVIISNVFFQMKDRDVVVSEIARILRPRGKVLVIDWSEARPGLAGFGPVSQAIFSSAAAKDLFQKHGFVLDKTINPDHHHYGLIFNKA